jgi:WD40 repeat protein
VSVSPDGQTLAAGTWSNHSLRIWDLESGEETKTYTAVWHGFKMVILFPDGWRALVLLGDQDIGLWDLRTGRRIHNLNGHSGNVTCCAVNPSGRLLATGGSDHTIRLWSSNSGQAVGGFYGGSARHLLCFPRQSRDRRG